MDENNELFEVFVTTNGRSTFKYCYESLMSQKGIKFKLTIIDGMKWLDANNRMIEECKTPFFIRIDDDMLMHPYSILFMLHRSKKQSSKVAMRCFHLWEPWSNKRITGVKIYTHAICRKIGFRVNKMGKLDTVFRDDINKIKCKIIRDGNSIIGIHSCSTFKEHLQYALMRGEHKNKDYPKKKRWMKNHIGKFNISLEDQLSMSRGFLNKLNRKHRTHFARFVRRAKRT